MLVNEDADVLERRFNLLLRTLNLATALLHTVHDYRQNADTEFLREISVFRVHIEHSEQEGVWFIEVTFCDCKKCAKSRPWTFTKTNKKEAETLFNAVNLLPFISLAQEILIIFSLGDGHDLH